MTTNVKTVPEHNLIARGRHSVNHADCDPCRAAGIWADILTVWQRAPVHVGIGAVASAAINVMQGVSADRPGEAVALLRIMGDLLSAAQEMAEDGDATASERRPRSSGIIA